MRVEQYVEAHSQATFSHSVCPECASRYFGPEMVSGQTLAPGETEPPAPAPPIKAPPGEF
jgi:hypothetical protein